MADYYPLIARVVGDLGENTSEARRVLYERVRTALDLQLRGGTAALDASAISREHRALEDAIRRVESEVVLASLQSARANAAVSSPTTAIGNSSPTSTGFWKRLFSGNSGSTGKTTDNKKDAAQRKIPWNYARTGFAGNDEFFNAFKDSLPAIFNEVRDRGSDPVMLLVAMEQEKWRALLALLYARPSHIYVSPESYIGDLPQLQNNGYCSVYVAPEINGQILQTGIYVLERAWLLSELGRVRDLPMLFLDLIREEKHPGHFPIVVLATAGMRVERLPYESHGKASRPQPKTSYFMLAGCDFSPEKFRTHLLHRVKEASTVPSRVSWSSPTTGYLVEGVICDRLLPQDQSNSSFALAFERTSHRLKEIVVNGQCVTDFLEIKNGQPENILSQSNFEAIGSLSGREPQTWVVWKHRDVGNIFTIVVRDSRKRLIDVYYCWRDKPYSPDDLRPH
jgi:hypothetical protein